MNHQLKGMDAISLEGNCKRHQVIGVDEAISTTEEIAKKKKKKGEKRGAPYHPLRESRGPWGTLDNM